MVELVGKLNLDTIRAAYQRIRPYIHRTPVLTNSWLNDASRTSLFFKCENFQKVGAFKARGATNAVFALDDEAAQRAVDGCNGRELQGRALVVNEARPMNSREGGGGRPPRR